MDTYSVVKGMFAQPGYQNKNFYLTKVNWVLNAEDDLIIENGKVTAISILEKLLEANPKTGYNHAQALTGTITVAVEGAVVNQYEIYEKYNKLFPNVVIRYDSSKVEVEGAKTVIFYDNDVADEAVVFYEVFTDGTKTIEYLTSAEGPNGVALGTPAKGSTNENDYVFTGN